MKSYRAYKFIVYGIAILIGAISGLVTAWLVLNSNKKQLKQEIYNYFNGTEILYGSANKEIRGKSISNGFSVLKITEDFPVGENIRLAGSDMDKGYILFDGGFHIIVLSISNENILAKNIKPSHLHWIKEQKKINDSDDLSFADFLWVLEESEEVSETYTNSKYKELKDGILNTLNNDYTCKLKEYSEINLFPDNINNRACKGFCVSERDIVRDSKLVN